MTACHIIARGAYIAAIADFLPYGTRPPKNRRRINVAQQVKCHQTGTPLKPLVDKAPRLILL